MKRALITGITGQDGAYLAEFLLEGAMRCMVSRDGLLFSTQTA
jgi:GDP-D-mannose dehydratase